MKKIVTIAGARPQFVKAAALSRAFKEHGQIREVLVHTGQHYDDEMSAIFFSELSLPEPAWHLGIHNMTHGAMTGRMLEKIEEVLIREQPELVVVFGDTNSTLAGALAAKKLKIPLAHIEAGLRSYDMQMPEEINRVATDRISDLLFCPSAVSVENLLLEGFRTFPAKIFQHGDIMLDAARQFAPMAKSEHKLPGEFILCTLHREALVQSPRLLKKTMLALIDLHKELPVVFPAHPRTSQKIAELFDNLPFKILRPFGYLEMLHALQHCSCVVTDSGGLQKEAYFFDKPCITLRANTEWKELTDAGVNILAGDEAGDLVSLLKHFNANPPDFSQQFYGTGTAATLITDSLFTYLEEKQPS